MKAFSGNFRASLSASRAVIALLVVLILVIVVLLSVWTVQLRDQGYQSAHLQNVSDLRVLSQELAKNSSEAAQGSPLAFSQLLSSRNEFQNRWQQITEDSTSEAGQFTPAVSARINTQDFGQTWAQVRLFADQIIESDRITLDANEAVTELSSLVPRLQAEYDTVLSVLIASDAPAQQVAYAQRQSLLAERLLRSSSRVLTGEQDALMATSAFGRDAGLFADVLRGQLQGSSSMGIDAITNPRAIASLERIQADFQVVFALVDDILELSTEVFQVREAAQNIFAASEVLLLQAEQLDADIKALGVSPIYTLMLVLLAMLALALVVMVLVLIYRNGQKDLQRTQRDNEANQTAILRLLDELADLADGDLSTQATVTEDFTGAIADSINYAIDQMRGLVSAINHTAESVTEAAQQSQSTAMNLADAAENQAQEIAGASAAINEMAVSIDQVSANAAESSVVAEKAVAISKKGADVVQATIHGMDTIREQIQDTSKRIKRLGESSQEIGDIVSLINDIADQTNILALNAAIQASMAGDAGRGFAVVADEVQRLAERSSSATKQIESLVKAIQSDTNEAVISMEQTTSEVVRGARLAQDAGIALEEVENVSKSLAELIQNISNAARQQASSAGHISNTMNIIQEITTQTSTGTSDTAKGIGDLAQLARELRASVAGFKLPDDANFEYK